MIKRLLTEKIIPIVFLVIISACGGKKGSSKNTVPEKMAEVTNNGSNYLSMKINGVEWKADNEITGAFHPKGYNKAIIIAGSKGANNKDEQTFTITLYNTNGPATFDIKNGNADNNVVQLSNTSPENFLYGSMMGFALNVSVSKAGSNPTEIEATFEGELTGNAGDILKITEGKFYYHE